MAQSAVRSEARRRVGPKRGRIGPVIERLVEEHPDAVIALRFRDDLELLVSVMLSAQTTDVTVNRVTEKLFRKYRSPEDYLAVPPEELESDLRPTGTFRQKAKNLRGTMRLLLEEFDGRVPDTIEELVRLPGVGRKTANVVVAERGAAQGIVVDTHVRRLSQRLGFTRKEDPVKIERDLARLVPRADWARFPHLLIWHGRRVCNARRPRCAACVLADLCPSSRLGRLRASAGQRDEEPAVLVVGGKEVGRDLLGHAGARTQHELLVEAAHSPLERQRGRGAPRRSPRERLRHVVAEQVALLVARELEDALAGRDDAARPGRRRRTRSRARGSSRPSARTGSRSRSSGTRPPAGSGPRGRRRRPTALRQLGQMK